MNVLMCPVCKESLIKSNKSVRCSNGHSFDIAKEGYVNLLSAHKSGDSVGDNKEMARSRRDFLNKDYYKILADAVSDCVLKYSCEGGNVLDICCGEGYYTNVISNKLNRNYYGFDISKNMVRLAAKRSCNARFFVANIANIPISTGSIDFAFHLFAPFHSDEFSRVLADDGVIVTAIPGKEHLFQLKSVLYEKPYYNDEKPPESGKLKLLEKIRVKKEIDLKTQDDIQALFRMTPYYYHTPSQGMAKLESINELTTVIEFVLLVYTKHS